MTKELSRRSDARDYGTRKQGTQDQDSRERSSRERGTHRGTAQGAERCSAQGATPLPWSARPWRLLPWPPLPCGASLIGISLIGSACGSAQPDLATPAPDAPTLPANGGAVDTRGAEVGAERGRRADAVGSDSAQDAEGDDLLVGVEWRWVRFVDPLAGAIDIPEPERYTVTFDDAGVVHVRADCKEGQGAYMADRAELIVRILRTTEDDCGEASLADEFVDNVNSASGFRVVDGELVISLRWETGTMRFVPSEEDSERDSDQAPERQAPER